MRVMVGGDVGHLFGLWRYHPPLYEVFRLRRVDISCARSRPRRSLPERNQSCVPVWARVLPIRGCGRPMDPRVPEDLFLLVLLVHMVGEAPFDAVGSITEKAVILNLGCHFSGI